MPCEMVREEGMMITTVATSRRTAELARSVGLDVRRSMTCAGST
jgi:ribose 5-phosphate isomerase